MIRTRILAVAGILLCGFFLVPDAQASGLAAWPVGQAVFDARDLVFIQHDGQGSDKMRRPDRAEKRQKMKERIESLPPEQQEEARRRLQEMQEKRRKLAEELKNLPPEEREARMAALREQFREQREKQREEFRQKFQERWEDASAEERAEFCDNARERCENDGKKKACAFAEKACSSE